ncbi:Methyltransferase type 12 OS=Granulicella mallensis (strain ATCC BAA-1857 / DSM 23137 / MP5ACTX8) GN=AciX8_1681 PE=4 SV=1: Methyltransf_18 [Gemmataceae bacterium]|nr:Methyltransferase type 12 OS=Granulicella mallensis (strain ATCC BAA-1857 / DSM 23137 / MP5ACTX8) GN=AciX8_1681 PE=4 SV=1: Methyltransf_18 [Gemmataceae bacterium]VTU02466.1 Methyltransferase type 12 OS=Granulicella mallensis (strain ATCC BAA-1857 / DSM 23137 / MP5ACTX8) GN=AciX8_1681 PE=4 SV=1: Methyltransf_18 [Gemmataceae bacterium]
MVPVVTRPNFDALAPHYRWLEAVTFGPLLQWCRTAFLPQLRDARRALVLGDGNGRFLAALLAVTPDVAVDAVDISPGMTALARRRTGNSPRVRFLVADAREHPLRAAEYDLVVTNFFLDCFGPRDLELVISRLVAALAPGGRFVIGDFRVPSGRFAGPAAALALAAMYAAFRLTTRLSAGRLVDPSPMLAGAGLKFVEERTRLHGFLTAQLWRKLL